VLATGVLSMARGSAQNDRRPVSITGPMKSMSRIKDFEAATMKG
jgi:hypothetical protein